MAEEEKPVEQWPVFLDQKCPVCEINDMKFKCLNCDELLCDSCKEIHLKSKMTKIHKVVCLETAEIYQSSEGATKCPIHTAEDLLMYCGTCELPICRDCVTSESHQNHHMVKIENILENKHKELSKLINQSKEKSSKYKDVVKIIDKNSQEFSVSVSEEIDKIKARNNQLKLKLDDITSDYIQKLQNADRENKRAMAELKQKKEDIRDLNQLIQQCEAKLEYKNIEMIQLATDITQKLDTYQTFDPPEISSPPNMITRDVDDQELVKLFGYLDTKTTAKVDLLLPQTKNIPSASPVFNVQVVSSFDNTENRIVTVGNDQAWLWSRNKKGISLVTSDSKVIQSIITDFLLYDAAVTTSGDLLVIAWDSNKVKKLDKTFTEIYKADGYKTRGITVTNTGKVLVGLFESKISAVRALLYGQNSKIVEIITTEHLIKTILRDISVDNLLSNDTVSICTNSNGDIIVVNDQRRVVSIKNYCTNRFIYDGKERNLTKSFNPQCVATDKYGNIMITDRANSVVHMINQDGKFLQYLITPKHGCDCPCGMSIDTSGRLWVCNEGSGKVIIVKYL